MVYFSTEIWLTFKIIYTNIPAIFISGGPMLAGTDPDNKNQKIDLLTVFEAVEAVKSNKMTKAQLLKIENEK